MRYETSFRTLRYGISQQSKEIYHYIDEELKIWDDNSRMSLCHTLSFYAFEKVYEDTRRPCPIIIDEIPNDRRICKTCDKIAQKR